MTSTYEMTDILLIDGVLFEQLQCISLQLWRSLIATILNLPNISSSLQNLFPLLSFVFLPTLQIQYSKAARWWFKPFGSRCILRLFQHPWQHFLTSVLSIALLKYFNPYIPFGKETQKNHVKNFAFCQNSLDPHPYTPLALTVKIHHSLCAQASLWKWAPKNAKFKILWKIWKMRQWWGTKNVYSKVTQKFHSIG